MNATGSERADVFVDDGKIVGLGAIPTADRTIDAAGLLVLPGVVDMHTHLASTPTFTPLDDFEHGTRAAVAGGVTTVVSMVYQEDGSLRRGIERAERDAARAYTDFAFHVVVTDPSDAALAELPELVDEGHVSLKVFMVTKNFVERRDAYRRLYAAAARNGMLVAVHAEDHALIARATAELHAAGKTGVRHFPESRPVEAEVVAIREAAEDARAAKVAMYLVHLSSRAAVDELRRAPWLFGETRPLYLYLTREQFEREDAALWVGQPPLRERDDLEAVWTALADGTLHTVGTDHIPWTRAQKLTPGLAFDKIPPGVANLETLLPMLYSEGVRKGRITVERMVDLLSTTPANLSGMAFQKGEIAIGRDADLVLFDPNTTRTIHASEMHSACDYDPYEGWEVTGWPRTVVVRGEVAFDGEIRAQPGAGRFVARDAGQFIH